MAIDFPNSPVDGQEYTADGVTYQYFATKGYWRTTRTGLNIVDAGSSVASSVAQVNYDGGLSQVDFDGINNLDGGSA